MTEPSDELDDLLAPRPGTVSPELRDAALLQTERRITRNRWAHRGTRAAIVLGIFAVGGVASRLARPESERLIEVPGETQHIVVPVLVHLPQSSPVPPALRLSASAAELRAEQEDNADAAANLYRQAGNAFLSDQDYANATRCYRLYLTRGGDAALTLEPSDSWLLVSLKNSAFKEKIDVTKNDG